MNLQQLQSEIRSLKTEMGTLRRDHRSLRSKVDKMEGLLRGKFADEFTAEGGEGGDDSCACGQRSVCACTGGSDGVETAVKQPLTLSQSIANIRRLNTGKSVTEDRKWGSRDKRTKAM